MFNVGDKGWVLSASEYSRKGMIKLEEKEVIDILLDGNKIKLKDKPYLIVNSWAVGKTPDEAAKLAMVYLIKTEVFNKEINNIDLEKEYKELEANHSELIFKYMGKIAQ